MSGHRLPHRDRLAERVLLDRSQRLARLAVASWPTAVEQRLELGEALYGNSWTERSTGELLDEVLDETLDAAAWACLAVQSIPGDLDQDTTAAVGEMVAQAIAGAANACACITAAQAALRKAQR